MAASPVLVATAPESRADEEIVTRVLAGEIDLFAIIMRRYNARLYRVAFSILRDEAEAEDVMEDAYVRAYQHLNQFAGRAKFSTWLTRIAVNEAFMRKRRSRRYQSLDDDGEEHGPTELVSAMPDPEQVLSHKALATSLQKAILALPEKYRTVLVVRGVHELTVAETAECLGISQENVKVRLHRARAALRRVLNETSGNDLHQAFPLRLPQCDRLIVSVLAHIRILSTVPSLRV